MAVHKHRTGWRGSLTLTTPAYPTKAEAEAALADLRTRVQTWRLTSEAEPVPPPTAAPRPPRLDPFRPSCDYPLLIALHGPEWLGLGNQPEDRT
jgi:hypothetical protein